MSFSIEKVREYVRKNQSILPTHPTWVNNLVARTDRNDFLTQFVNDTGVGPDGKQARYDEAQYEEREKMLGDKYQDWLQDQEVVSEEYIFEKGAQWVIANIVWLKKLGVITEEALK